MADSQTMKAYVAVLNGTEADHQLLEQLLTRLTGETPHSFGVRHVDAATPCKET